MPHAKSMKTTRSTARAALIATAAALSLAVAGCAGDSEDTPLPSVEQPGQDADADDTEDAESDEGESDAPAESETTDDATEESTEDTGNGDATDGEHDGLFAAINLAESETGGTAFEVDDADGGNWEIHIADGDDELEVLVTADGTEVLDVDREGSLDSEDRDGLAAATLTISEAIEIAAEHGTGRIDDVDLDSEGGAFAWEVTFSDDTEVYIDVATGEVLRVETD